LLLAVLTAVTCLWLSACAGSGGQTSNSGPLDCIINRGIRDFDTLDDRNLIIYGIGRNAYHVVLATPSINLRGEFVIGIYDSDNDGRICSIGGDAILIDGPLSERIPIRRIEALDADDVEALKVEFGIIEAAGDAVTITVVE